MLGREMKDVFVRWIDEERATLQARFQLLWNERYVTQAGHHFANFQAPVRILTVSTISAGGISKEANGYVISSGTRKRFRFAANGECCCGEGRPESRNRGRDRAARR